MERRNADSTTIDDADLAASITAAAPTTISGSPKRISLDERLEKELGIKRPDLSKPPPGYLPSGHHNPSVPPPNVPPPGHHNSSVPPPASRHQPPPGYPPIMNVPPPSLPNLSEPPPNLNQAPNIDDAKLRQIGNMVQIVPEQDSSSKAIDDYNKRMEEIQQESQKKEEERKLKREQRIKERLEEIQQQQLQEDQQRPKDKVRYISLKPKKSKVVEEENVEEEEEFVPRSPVPLPDNDVCKPILLKLGNLEAKKSLTLRFADGVLPGEGSPVDDDDKEDDDVDAYEEARANLPKKRRRVLLKVIRTKFVNDEDESSSSSDDDEDDDNLSSVLPPGPPSGPPPIWHTQQLIDRFGCETE